jgi:hypothetical protein
MARVSGEQMKTRIELIYDFMLALSSNTEFFNENFSEDECAELIFLMAAKLADKYLENV